MENFSVVVRCRPTRELSSAGFQGHQSCLEFEDGDETSLTLIDILPNESSSSASKEKFQFWHVASPLVDQPAFYKTSVKHVVEKALQGYNGTVIAFGPSGCGKTYTLSGIAGARGKGVIERATEQILNCIRRSRSGAAANLVVLASFCLIHREIVSDLLLDRSNVATRSSDSLLDSSVVEPKEGLEIADGEVIGLSQHVIRTSREVEALVTKGNQNRCMIVEQRETQDLSPFDDEDESLRSAAAHTVFMITVEHAEMSNSFAPISGTLMFVDMAASESLLTLSQAQAWNTAEDLSPRRSKLSHADASLRTLVRVIHTLSSNAKGTVSQTVPYRNSALTSLLRESIGGNCNTLFVCNVSPNASEYRETRHAIEVAQAATAVKNTANRRDLAEHALMSAYLREMRQKYRVVIVRDDNSGEESKTLGNAKPSHHMSESCTNKPRDYRPDRQEESDIDHKPKKSQGAAIQAANALAEAAVQSDDEGEDAVAFETTEVTVTESAELPTGGKAKYFEGHVEGNDAPVGDESDEDNSCANEEYIADNVLTSESMSNLLIEKSASSVVDTSPAFPTAQLGDNKNTVNARERDEARTQNGESGAVQGFSDVKSDDHVYEFSFDEESDEEEEKNAVEQSGLKDSGADTGEAQRTELTGTAVVNIKASLEDGRPSQVMMGGDTQSSAADVNDSETKFAVDITGKAAEQPAVKPSSSNTANEAPVEKPSTESESDLMLTGEPKSPVSGEGTKAVCQHVANVHGPQVQVDALLVFVVTAVC